MNYKTASKEELLKEKEALTKKYDEFKSMGLKLDMSRGKPAKDQLDLSNDMLSVLTPDDFKEGVELRNYGILLGTDQARELFASLLDVKKENIIICGNSSLNCMFDYITQCMLTGSKKGCAPWRDQGKIKFLCFVPGYDRHFAILEYYGIEMINVPLTGEGPDMDMVEELIKDKQVKGMFCVPKYSNPTGETYSDETVERIAKMKPAAEDFRIIWDNAYIIHDLYEDHDNVKNIFDLLKKYSNEDMVIEVASTSKVTFPGAGVACIACSENNIELLKSRMQFQTIGHDKLNQLRHTKYFKDKNGMLAHMKKHAAIMAPKFDAVTDEFEKSLGGTEIASWTKPKGGYFISLDVLEGTAKRVGELCKEAGVTLTPVGATFPYGKDPKNKNVRIAPSFPTKEDLLTATKILTVCVKLAAIESLLK